MRPKSPPGDKMHFFQPGERMPTRVVDYKQILTEQIQITAQILTFAYTTNEIFNAECAVNVLESLAIRQIVDPEYKRNMEKLIRNHERKWANLTKKERGKMFNHMKRSYIVSKFRLLMILLSKRGLSYIAEVSDYIGDKPAATRSIKPKEALI